jgi:DNA-binding transcriptional MerR regulator
MGGHGEKLTRKQEQAVAALLAQRTLKAAAQAVGVNESTLRTWLQQGAFVTAYREARRRVVEDAVAQLQRLTSKAVQALRRNLTAGSPADQVRAALGILDRAVKGVELLDIEERLAAVEKDRKRERAKR